MILKDDQVLIDAELLLVQAAVQSQFGQNFFHWPNTREKHSDEQFFFQPGQFGQRVRQPLLRYLFTFRRDFVNTPVEVIVLALVSIRKNPTFVFHLLQGIVDLAVISMPEIPG